MALYQVKEEWKSALDSCGVEFVMITGMVMMSGLFADNLDTLHMVSKRINFCSSSCMPTSS